jgi:ABC-2 type transport system permease protein
MEVLLGHLAAFSTILVGQVTVVILIAVYGFDIPVNGSPLLLFAVGIFLGLAAMCMGLFVSSKAKSEFQAMQLNMPIMFPVMLLSGILWPVEALPTFIQPLSWALPSTWTAEAFRSIMVRGWGMSHSEVWIAFVFNLAFAAFALLLAARSLKARE